MSRRSSALARKVDGDPGPVMFRRRLSGSRSGWPGRCAAETGFDSRRMVAEPLISVCATAKSSFSVR